MECNSASASVIRAVARCEVLQEIVLFCVVYLSGISPSIPIFRRAMGGEMSTVHHTILLTLKVSEVSQAFILPSFHHSRYEPGNDPLCVNERNLANRTPKQDHITRK